MFWFKKKTAEDKAKELQQLRSERIKMEGDAKLEKARLSELKRIEASKEILSRERKEKMQNLRKRFDGFGKGVSQGKRQSLKKGIASGSRSLGGPSMFGGGMVEPMRPNPEFMKPLRPKRR